MSVDPALAAVGQLLDSTWLAEIDPARQLSNNDYVHSLDVLSFYRRGIDERVEYRDWSEIGKQPEIPPQAQQRGFRSAGKLDVVPLRPADIHPSDYLLNLLYYLGADSVTGQNPNFSRSDHSSMRTVLFESDRTGTTV